jgi:hypothetical protein
MHPPSQIKNIEKTIFIVDDEKTIETSIWLANDVYDDVYDDCARVESSYGPLDKDGNPCDFKEIRIVIGDNTIETSTIYRYKDSKWLCIMNCEKLHKILSHHDIEDLIEEVKKPQMISIEKTQEEKVQMRTREESLNDELFRVELTRIKINKKIESLLMSDLDRLQQLLDHLENF